MTSARRTEDPTTTTRRPVLLWGSLLSASLAFAGCAPKDDAKIHLNGRIEAPVVDLGPKVAGRVLEVLVKEGDRVKAGDLLVKLDLGEQGMAVAREEAGVKSAKARYDDLSLGSRKAEIAAAEAEVGDRRAAVALARKELERQKSLLEKKVGTERDFDRARTDLERTEAALKMSAERLLLQKEGFRKNQTQGARFDVDRAETVLRQSEVIAKEAELRAPADGVILHRIAEPGQLLVAGQAGVTMAFANRLYVRTFIPETRLGQVKAGAVAHVTVDAFPGKTFPAKVTEISETAEFTPKPVETRSERVNLVFAAKVDLDNGWKEPLVPGQPADVTLDAR